MLNKCLFVSSQCWVRLFDFVLVGHSGPWKVVEHSINEIVSICLDVYVFLVWWRILLGSGVVRLEMGRDQEG